MTQRKSDLSKEIKACTTTYSREFLRSLPSGVEQLYKSKTFIEMMEQIAIGSHVSSRTSNSSIGSAIQSHAFVPIIITYYELYGNVQKSDEHIGKLSVLGLKAFYSQDLRDSTPLISGLLTILSAHCTSQQLDKSGIAETLKSNGYEIQPCKITPQQLDLFFLQELSTFEKNSALNRHHKDFYKFAIIFGLSSLLFLGKTVTPKCIENYLNSIWQVLASNVGCEKFIARKPDVENCNAVHNFLSMCNRKAFFELYRSLSKQQSNRFNTAFGLIVESLKWADMEYINLIDKYIVQKNPELLSSYHSYFGGEKDRMKHVYKLMEGLPKNDHPFLKLLLPYNQLTVITRKNFKNLYNAARAVASIDDCTISYINYDDTEYVKDIKHQIRHYVLTKTAKS